MAYDTNTIDTKVTTQAVPDVLLTKLYDAAGPVSISDFLRSLQGTDKTDALKTLDVLLRNRAIEQANPGIVTRILSYVGVTQHAVSDAYRFIGKESRFFYHRLIRNPQTEQG